MEEEEKRDPVSSAYRTETRARNYHFRTISHLKCFNFTDVTKL